MDNERVKELIGRLTPEEENQMRKDAGLPSEKTKPKTIKATEKELDEVMKNLKY